MPGANRRERRLKQTSSFDEITSLSISNAADGDLLVFDSATGLWRNAKELTGDFSISGDLSLTDLVASGAISADSITLTNDATVGGNLAVTGTSTLQGAVNANGTLTVAGAATLDSTLAVAGALTGAGFSFSGNGSVGGDLTVTGSLTADSISIDALALSGGLDVTGNSIFRNDLTVDGNLTIGSAFAAGALSTPGDLNVGGDSYLRDQVIIGPGASGQALIDTDGTEFLFRSRVTSAVIQLEGTDSGDATVDLAQLDPDGAFTAYNAGTAMLRTGANTAEVWDGSAWQDVVLDTRQVIAGTLLTGGGALSGNVTLNVDEASINHDALTNFVANEHIDHSTVSVSAGTGLSGGGTIAANRTLSLSHLGLEALTDPNADRVLFWDDSAGALAWLTMGSNLTITGTTLDAAGTGGSSTLSGLDDTAISGTQATGEVLYWDGADWADTGALIIDPASGVNITGTLEASGALTIEGNQALIRGTSPRVVLRESDNADKDWFLLVDGGGFSLRETNTGTQRFRIAAGGNVTIDDGTLALSRTGGAEVASGDPGSPFRLLARNAANTSTHELLNGDPDGSTDLYYNGAKALETSSLGGAILLPGGSGAANTTQLRWQTAAGAFRAFIGYGGDDDLKISNDVASGHVIIDADDAIGANRVLIDGDPDGSTDLYYAGTTELRTADHNATDFLAGAEVKDYGGTFRQVGFLDAERVSGITASRTIANDDWGKTLQVGGTASPTFTFDNDADVPTSVMLTIVNNSTNSMTLAEGTGVTLRWFDGAGGQNGNRTLAAAGVVTVFKAADTEMWVWGNGLS